MNWLKTISARVDNRNRGMFLFKASKHLGELRKYRSDIYQDCEASRFYSNKDLNL
jgi:mannose-1-phosphate guanylyltransferase